MIPPPLTADAVADAARELTGRQLRAAADFEALGERWRPWRSVAARMLWQHSLIPE